MATNSVLPPFPTFFDTDGAPLDGLKLSGVLRYPPLRDFRELGTTPPLAHFVSYLEAAQRPGA